MQFRKKANLLREGLKINKKLKGSFYHFIYEKHIDWAVFLTSFGMLPNIPSLHWYILVPKLVIIIVVVFLIVKYLKTWRSLESYYKVVSKLKEQIKELINKKKFDDAGDVLQKLTDEIKLLPEKAEKKKGMFKNYREYLRYEKIDFLPIEDILNKDAEATKTAIGVVMATAYSLVSLREIPREEYRNYKRLIHVFILTILYFIIHALDYAF